MNYKLSLSRIAARNFGRDFWVLTHSSTNNVIDADTWRHATYITLHNKNLKLMQHFTFLWLLHSQRNSNLSSKNDYGIPMRIRCDELTCVSCVCQSTVFRWIKTTTNENDDDTYEKWPKFPYRFSRPINFLIGKTNETFALCAATTLNTKLLMTFSSSFIVYVQRCECGKKMLHM